MDQKHGGGLDEDTAVSAFDRLGAAVKDAFSPRPNRPRFDQQDTAVGAGVPLDRQSIDMVTPDGRYEIDPTKPALPDNDVASVLRDIKEILLDSRPNRQPKASMRTRTITLDAGANSADIADPTGFSTVYIPPVPRSVAVYMGPGRRMLIAQLVTGQSLRANLPYETDALYLEWGAGTAGDQLLVYLSADPLEIQIDSGGASGGPVGTYAEDSPSTSGDRGGLMLAVRQSAPAPGLVLTDTGGDYSPIGVNPYGAVAITSGEALNGDAMTPGLSVYRDIAGSTRFVAGHNILFNESSYDRQRGNTEAVAFASAARTAVTETPDIINYNARGIAVQLWVSAASGTGGLQLSINAVDPGGTLISRINALPTAVTTTGVFYYAVYPGLGTGTVSYSQATDGVLPRRFRIRITPGDATSYTYSVVYSLIV